LAANKSDIYEMEVVNEETGRTFADEINAVFKNTSAKSGQGVEVLFIYIIMNLKCFLLIY